MNDISKLISTDMIQVEISVRLGALKMSVAEISRLRVDDVIALDRSIDDGVEICVADKVIAYGELSTSEGDENALCLRITRSLQE
ncbi:FliM/FliN family flagellar motor C-terminal domain-containing protein [uncultured Paracoccus sp.]|uniref:FliM/FliN family flagellar motor C-terminal domain-containing protein n=1 Tax=uncultured Paracoccus sp. TaxID=189685 RepID=UPI0025DB32E6|nr:FliM/FliN family flagellar motor C-terminal domain-containing protein [uncultured Paracoccus sp.]